MGQDAPVIIGKGAKAMVDLDAIECLADIPAAQAAVRGGEAAIVFEGRVT